jgi:hypothetical protein
MSRKIAFLGLGLLACLAMSGCTGLIEFNTPSEFKDGKVKEDPPGTMLPQPLEQKTC